MKAEIPKNIRETNFNYVSTDSLASFSTYDRKWISKIKSYAKKFPDEVKIIAENEDGSICTHIPKSWFKITPPRQLSEEQREKLRERGKLMGGNRKTGKMA